MTGVRTVEVGGDRPYAIHIGAGLRHDGVRLARGLRGRRALLASDSHVEPLYGSHVSDALRGQRRDLALARWTVPAGEASKDFAHWRQGLERLADAGATRDACVFALGGGVVGDLAGFVAACWMRGIDHVQLPTSLLAMVDSSVGGKTAIDLPQGKNLVGAFHPPRLVIADTETLRTLPDRELRAGLAEVVKYGAIRDAGFLDWLDAEADALLARDEDALAEAIARSCGHKADIVARDPLERGERALLNFGHTFAHAIEAGQDYAGVNHGEAVAIGMVQAARLSARLGLASDADAERLARLLQRFGLATEWPVGLDAAQSIERMRIDKKATADGMRFVLWNHPGHAHLMAGVPDAAVIAVLAGD